MTRWVNPELTLSFCGHRLSQLGAAGKRCNMTIRLKNPKQAGFVRVNLRKGPMGDDTYNGWHWQDSLGIYKQCINIFLTDTEIYLSKLFPAVTSVTVWVKFEKA